MSRTGKAKSAYVQIPYRLYAAILQDIESRSRSVSLECAVQECIREKYAQTKVKREYLVRAGNEVSGLTEGSRETAALHIPRQFSAAYEVDSFGRARPFHERIVRRRGARPRSPQQP